MAELSRYSRQMRLRNIGVEGQSALMRRKVALRTCDDAAEVEKLYLARAGVTLAPSVPRETSSEMPSEMPDSAFELHDPTARKFADGAHAALLTIRELVSEQTT